MGKSCRATAVGLLGRMMLVQHSHVETHPSGLEPADLTGQAGLPLAPS
jgi:hypothetical protein